MRFLITETCDYLVEAENRDEAEERFLEHGPALPDRADVSIRPVEFVGVIERRIEPADSAI